MKMIDLTCTNCGAQLQVNSELTKCTCNYCGKEMLIDSEVLQHEIKNAYEAGYLAEMGRQKALKEIEEQKQKEALEKRLAEQQKIAEQYKLKLQRIEQEQQRLSQQSQKINEINTELSKLKVKYKSTTSLPLVVLVLLLGFFLSIITTSTIVIMLWLLSLVISPFIIIINSLRDNSIKSKKDNQVIPYSQYMKSIQGMNSIPAIVIDTTSLVQFKTYSFDKVKNFLLSSKRMELLRAEEQASSSINVIYSLLIPLHERIKEIGSVQGYIYKSEYKKIQLVIQNIIAAYQSKATLNVVVIYNTPGGQNHYQNTFSFSSVDILKLNLLNN